MERKIGEIFEYNGDWYQCVRSILTCSTCEIPRPCTKIRELGYCSPNMRNDKKQVIFKKLEKVGEVEKINGKFYQKVVSLNTYKGSCVGCSFIGRCKTLPTTCTYPTVYVEIKQNQEKMEEKKLNLKPFDLEKAKEGKPVCTRDGRKARIICFDRITCDDYSKIVACVTTYDGKDEYILTYGIDGYIVNSQHPKNEDLMMLPEKKEGWVNVYDADTTFTYAEGIIYNTKEEALAHAKSDCILIGTGKISWEE